jgi:hypothetical protein
MSPPVEVISADVVTFVFPVMVTVPLPLTALPIVTAPAVAVIPVVPPVVDMAPFRITAPAEDVIEVAPPTLALLPAAKVTPLVAITVSPPEKV